MSQCLTGYVLFTLSLFSLSWCLLGDTFLPMGTSTMELGGKGMSVEIKSVRLIFLDKAGKKNKFYMETEKLLYIMWLLTSSLDFSYVH